MSYHYQPAPSLPARLRPELPPVPPQLRSVSPSGRPPLPPIPINYLVEAAEQQRNDRASVLQPQPHRPEVIIPAESLQTQADAFPRSATVAPMPLSFPGGFTGGPAYPEEQRMAMAPTFPQPSHPVNARYSQPVPQAPGPFPPPQLPQRPATARPTPSAPISQSMGDLHLASGPPRLIIPESSIGLGPAPGARSPMSARRTTMPEYGNTVPGSPLKDNDGPGKPRKLAKPAPDMASLASARNPDADPVARVRWARAVLKFIERHQAESAMGGNATRISDPQMVKFTDEALKIILSAASAPNPVPEALYLRADLSVTGSFPSYRAKDPKVAFRDFEAAANKGYKAAWFRIGREYEAFEEWSRAVNAHERGMSLGDCSSTYRLGMAYLLGQLDLQPDIVKAVAYLKTAADLADEETPQPTYIFGMLLAGEFESLPQIPADVLHPDIREARNRIERAAYLGFAAAQYKMGWLHEYAQMGCAFDPLLSVEYYSLASKQGEMEADMALSKWFLCGAEDCFPANESLAMTFAEKAARKGLPSAMFAVAYYFEVGIGGRKDLTAARKWYTRAVSGGNEDAKQRLEALDHGAPGLSRNEHEANVDVNLVRKRTMAAKLSEKEQGARPGQPPMPGFVGQVGGGGGALSVPGGGAALRRGETMRRVEEAKAVAQTALAASKAQRRQESAAHPTSQGPPAAASRPSQTGSASSQSIPTGRPTPGAGGPPGSQLQSKRPAVQLSDDGPVLPSSSASPATTLSSASPPSSAAPAKPMTTFNSFADMGIPTAKASSSSDCLIM